MVYHTPPTSGREPANQTNRLSDFHCQVDLEHVRVAPEGAALRKVLAFKTLDNAKPADRLPFFLEFNEIVDNETEVSQRAIVNILLPPTAESTEALPSEFPVMIRHHVAHPVHGLFDSLDRTEDESCVQDRLLIVRGEETRLIKIVARITSVGGSSVLKGRTIA